MRGETATVHRHLGKLSQRTFASTLLPFLYNTRTLRTLPARWSPVVSTRSFRKSAAWKTDPDHVRQAYLYAQETEEEPTEQISTPMRYASEQSSLTNAEREIFERIYQEAEQLKQSSEVTEEQEVERLIAGNAKRLDDQPERLDTLFEQALPKLRDSLASSKRAHQASPLDNVTIRANAKAKTEAREKDVQERSTNIQVRRVRARDHLDTTSRRDGFARLDEPFYKKYGFLPEATSENLLGERSSASQLANLDNIKRELVGSDLDPKARELLVASYNDTQRVDKLFSVANTDMELWHVLKKEVFSRVEELVSSLTHASPTSTTTKSKKSKGKKKKKGSESASVTIDQEGEVVNPSASVVASPGPPTDTVPLHLATLRQTYAQHVWAAQRVFRVRFPYSPYAVAILPTIKSLGPVSYALAASTELYDELLYMRWRVYRDPHACADILGEMLDRGIETSPRTRAVFRDAGLQWLAARNQASAEAYETSGNSSEYGESNAPETRHTPAFKVRRVVDKNEYVPPKVSAFQMAWWSLEGVQSGFRRWQLLEKEDLARIEQIKEGEARAQQVESREDAFDEELERLTSPRKHADTMTNTEDGTVLGLPGNSLQSAIAGSLAAEEATTASRLSNQPPRPKKGRTASREDESAADSGEAEPEQDRLAAAV